MHNSQARGQEGRPIAVPMIANAVAHGEKTIAAVLASPRLGV
jgi:hypothetical protein